MIEKPANTDPEMLFLHGEGGFLLRKVQAGFRRHKTLDEQANEPRRMQALNRLVNAWLFREFRPICNADNPVQQSSPLAALKAPGYRLGHIPRPEAPFYRLLRLQQLKSGEMATAIGIDAATRQLAADLANHSPFMRNALWFSHYDDLMALPADNLQALLAATLVNQQSITPDSSQGELELFYMGVCSGYINMQLGAEEGFNPLLCFLAPLIHHLALMAIYRELLACPALPAPHLLLDDIDAIHLRLSYWIAKDWGLPDDLLRMLRERFSPENQPALPALLMQKSEHAWLAVRLHQLGLLTRQQVSDFLALMQVEYTGLGASLSAISH